MGKILPEAAAELGLGTDRTVCTSTLDQAAGAIGAGNIREGMFSETVGAALPEYVFRSTNPYLILHVKCPCSVSL